MSILQAQTRSALSGIVPEVVVWRRGAIRGARAMVLAAGLCSTAAFGAGLVGVSISAGTRHIHSDLAAAAPALDAVQTNARSRTLSQLDGGIRSAMAEDRANGFRDGMVESLRDERRTLRLTAKDYATPFGAKRAYASVVRYLERALPDPSLHVVVRPFAGLGSAATLGQYTSSFGMTHYTVSALAAVRGTRLCEAQGYPTKVDDGIPMRDRPDLTRMVHVCLAD